ncbi:MAG: hypothetical protein KC502_03235 [Myxococcales bacterium]|nr:hypothetical protein [Myxococcales bacterium]
MTTRLLVLDFDGTVTDAEAEGAPYHQGCLEDVALLSGLELAEVTRLADAFEAEVQANPQEHGWVFGGHIVAPATVDPYLRIMPIARHIFDEAGAFLVQEERNRLLEGLLYKYNYRKTLVAFREGARETLLSMEDKPVHVVTNSHTDAVQNKIRVLGGEAEANNPLQWLIDRVHGSAQKYVLDPDWTEVPESMALPGLGRPVLLRRRLYADCLQALLNEAGADWSELMVVGDIFELDLALPLAMGARVGLIVNDFTPHWEKDFLRDHPRGKLLSSVPEIPGYAGW